MSPALIRLNDLKPFFTHEAGKMHVRSTLHSRSDSSGGVQNNTIIFIVVGVVCLFLILAGFYLVSRSHTASNAVLGVPCSHPQHSPIIQPPSPRHKRNLSEYWKIWKTRRNTSTEPPAAAEVPTLQVSPAPSSPSLPPRAMTYPLIVPRPSQTRRVTSLSVTTSFSHSHITQEALNDFRVSAYDLDGDLEAEMLNSARDDIWSGHPFAMEGRREVRIEEIIEGQVNTTHVIDGSIRGYALTQWKGDDYENSGACQNMASDSNSVEGDVVETVELVM